MSLRPWFRCPACGCWCRTDDRWVCRACEPDAIAEALPKLLAGLLRRITPWTTCRYDRCLLRAEEACPACSARYRKRRVR